MEKRKDEGNKTDVEEEVLEEELTPVKKKEPLPAWGRAALFIPVTILLTIAGVILGHRKPITLGIPTIAAVRYAYMGIGIFLAITALLLLLRSISDSQLFLNLKAGKLITTGVYSWTRHPLYSGVLFGCTGILFISGNAFFYAIPLAMYFWLIHLLKSYEEPLLALRFGDAYTEYVKKVNRIIPWKKHL